jgi:Protein of unknown function (Hypoth_ymh)
MNDEAREPRQAAQVLQIIYDLLRQREAWPTFRTVDLRIDRLLHIEDSRAALAAIPALYLQRPWRATGFYDADEVRLSLRGVEICEGGPDDLNLLAVFIRWLVQVEQALDEFDDSDLVVTSVEFANTIGLRIEQPSSVDSRDGSASVSSDSIGTTPIAGGEVSSSRAGEPGDEASDVSAPLDPEIAANRAALIRLRLLADLLPRFWGGAGYLEAWRWQYHIDRQMLRPYRHVDGVEQLLAYGDQQRHEQQQRQEIIAQVAYTSAGFDVLGSAATDEDSTAEAQSSEARLSQDADQLEVMLTLLRPEIVVSAGDQLRKHQYDDAIFAAYRRVESYLQERARLPGTIGDPLVKQAFEEIAQPIQISARSQDSHRLAELLRGALGLLKGDRSHKDKPALPCRSTRECLRQLAQASALLDLLDRDVSVAPSLRGYHHGGDVLDLWVERASAQSQVWLDDHLCEIISHQPGSLALDVTGIPSGEHDVFIVDGTRTSLVTPIWLEMEAPRNAWYRVKEINVPLFSDSTGTERLPATGLRLTVLESGVPSERIVPTVNTYHVGDYVEWHWDVTARSGASGDGNVVSTLGPTWVHDRPGQELTRIWEKSILFDGDPIAPAHEARLMKITLEPERLLMRLGEKAPVRLLGHYTDGVAIWADPINSFKATVSDESTVHANGGTLIAKGYGTASLRVEHDGRYGSSAVQVASHPAGTLADVLTGLPPVAGIAWAMDGLIVSTRTSELRRLTLDGKYQIVAGVPTQPPTHGGTDNISAAGNGDLAIRLVGHGDVLVLDAASEYRKSRWIPRGQAGAVMAMTWHDNNLILGFNTGIILRVHPDGSVAELASLGPVVTSLSRTEDALLVLTGSGERKLWHIPFDRPDGKRDLLAEAERVAVNKMAWLNGGIYLTEFHGGRVLKLENGQVLAVATGIENPDELTAAPDGTIFIAEFGRGAVRRIFSP